MTLEQQEQIRRWWGYFHNDRDDDRDVSDYVELRAFVQDKPYSGYFNTPDEVIQAAAQYDHAAVYFTVNPLKRAVSGRVQCGQMLKATSKSIPTTSDNDIAYRRWIFIDIDPERPAGTNATNEEKGTAAAVAVNLMSYLTKRGWQLPVMCDSGNGYHLFYRTDLHNDKDTAKLLERMYAAFDATFSLPNAHIDVSVKNAARICKLPGTFSRKGRHTDERPQRMDSFMLPAPGEVWMSHKVTQAEIEAVIADLAPETQVSAPTPASPRVGRFDANAFVKEHLDVKDVQRDGTVTKYVLKTCPFNDQHKDCSCVFVPDDGPIAFTCRHNSCQDKHWRDVRLLFEPDSYAPKTRSVTRRQETPSDLWKTMPEIEYVDYSQMPRVTTGYQSLEDKLHGLRAGEVTVLSGNSGSGKSTFLNNIVVNVLRSPADGPRPVVAFWSAELTEAQFKNWLYQTAAGGLNEPKPDGSWGPPVAAIPAIDDFFGDSVILRNNDYGSSAKDILADIEQVTAERHANLVVIDNLMAVDLSGMAFDKFEAQGVFMGELCNLARRASVHIILVAHPRKSMEFLRKEHISGSADITNRADNVLIFHRVNKDFETRAAAFFSKEELADFVHGNYSAAVEIVKNRAFGEECLIGLYFDKRKMRYADRPGESWVLPCLENRNFIQEKIPF